MHPASVLMVAALPMVVLIVVLNVVKLAVPVSLLVGILVAVYLLSSAALI